MPDPKITSIVVTATGGWLQPDGTLGYHPDDKITFIEPVATPPDVAKTPEMVERVARAIYKAWDEGFEAFWADAAGIDAPPRNTFEEERELYENLARAAIDAMLVLPKE